MRYGLASFFVLAGANHFVTPEWYLEHQMPPWIPFPLAALYVSGLAEVLGGIGLLVPRLRRWAGWGLVALLIAIFPANIHMASVSFGETGLGGETVGLLLRLLLQPVFIVVVLWAGRDGQNSISIPPTGKNWN